MAHADVFPRIQRNPSQEPAENKMDKKALETIKLLGRQMIEMQEIINKQNDVMRTMKDEIISLKTKQAELEGNIKLTIIDQRDLSKQLRTVKATAKGQELITDRRITGADDIARRFYPNYEESKVITTNDKVELKPQQQRVQTRQENPNITKNPEQVAKEYIFGRLPKLLNLD